MFPREVSGSPVMQTLCTRDHGWHVRMEWADGFVDRFQPANGPGFELLDIRDCRAFLKFNEKALDKAM